MILRKWNPVLGLEDGSGKGTEAIPAPNDAILRAIAGLCEQSFINLR